MIYEVTEYEVDCDKCGTILEICGTTAFLDKDAASDFAFPKDGILPTTASAIAPNVQKN